MHVNCYLNTNDDDDVNCTRIRTANSTTLLINVKKQKKARPDQYYKQQESEVQNPEILYTVTDAIDVEQGEGGFVNRIKAMHDDIAQEQTFELQRAPSRSDHLTEQLEACMPELGSSSRKSYRSSLRNSRGGTPRDESRLSRSSSSAGTPRAGLSRRSSTASSTCDELSSKTVEYIRAESEIVYSLSDDTGVEQGHSGFVKTLRAKHESIGEAGKPSEPLDRKLLQSKDKPYPV